MKMNAPIVHVSWRFHGNDGKHPTPSVRFLIKHQQRVGDKRHDPRPRLLALDGTWPFGVFPVDSEEQDRKGQHRHERNVPRQDVARKCRLSVRPHKRSPPPVRWLTPRHFCETSCLSDLPSAILPRTNIKMTAATLTATITISFVVMTWHFLSEGSHRDRPSTRDNAIRRKKVHPRRLSPHPRACGRARAANARADG